MTMRGELSPRLVSGKAQIILMEVKRMDLTNWTFMFTFGYSLDIYAYGSLRVAIDCKTGRKVLSYVSGGK